MILTRRAALIATGAAVGVLLLWVAAGELRHRPDLARLFSAVVAPSAFALAALALLVWLTFGWRRPARLEVEGGAFVAPAAHVVALTGVVVAASVVLLGVPPAMAGGINPIALIYLPLYSACCAGVVVWVAAIVRDAGRVELHPDGVRGVDAFGETFVPWEAVAAGPLPGSSSAGDFTLGVNGPDLVRRRGLAPRDRHRVRLATHLSAVHRGFLANAVNFYLANPPERAGIGTTGGYERLLAAIGGPRS
ncbi:hypothetical protein ACFFX1_51010 [Dactylosporangium sucinum]|uniref:Uncharacterized protein n=1 Tax=Dactylosporangium sucinum TaxID=1424081 RepID=A0A917U4D6_9ACTN|nr:hypothetical protein [Dactylosporangium sucinum]GGM54508.1 hypothetical protein GCM10007977_065190 [Dactylosporangium sucinum]